MKAVWGRWPRRSLGPWRSLGVWLAFGALAWIDARGPHVGQHAAVFAAIWTAIVIIGDVLGVVGGAIATTVQAAIIYLGSAVGWLTRRVADILVNTGSMFAKVWEASKGFYNAVLKPALVWLHDWYDRIKGWLARYFGPVFRFLSRVRTELLSLYKRFVRPILDIIDVVRGGLRVLGDLGVDWARALDRRLGDLEAAISHNFQLVLSKVNQIIDVVDGVVTFDRLFQRLPLLRSLDRDAGYWIRMFWRKQLATVSPEKNAAAAGQEYPLDEPFANGKELTAFYRGEDNRMQGYVSELLPLWFEAVKAREG